MVHVHGDIFVCLFCRQKVDEDLEIPDKWQSECKRYEKQLAEASSAKKSNCTLM